MIFFWSSFRLFQKLRGTPMRPRGGTIHTIGGDIADVVPRIADRTKCEPGDRRKRELLRKCEALQRDPTTGKNAGGGNEKVGRANQPQDSHYESTSS